MSFNVRNPEIEQRMRKLADRISASLPTGWGFALMLIKYGEDGEVFYISSAERAGVIQAVKQWLARQVQ